MQLLAKFLKNLHMGFRAILNFRKFKVALNAMCRFFKTLQKVASYTVDYISIIKNGGHRTCFRVIST